jgi:tetratricopeptide (TPR) repeat protein
MPEALFVGRERETDIYKKFLAKKTPWVLIITGLGGIGKSTLLHRLAEYTLAEPTLSGTGIVTLDFADEDLRHDPLKLLDKLTKDTAPYCDLQLVDIELKNELQQNFDQLAQLSKERIQTGVNEAEDLALREMRHQMRQLATEAFYLRIKTFKLDRLVIMLDTCEWLNEPEGVEVGQWVLNELIPGIHTRIRQKSRQCSVIIASRLQPRLDVINGQEQRRLNLPMLGKAEVDQYLAHMGMQDFDLRQRVYEVTHGHALCISIIGDFWQNRAEQSHPFTIADLPELELQEISEIALIRFTNERILKHLKSPFKELTRYGVLLRSFDLPLLKIVFPELLPEPEALDRFNRLTRYPYIESRGNYRYAFHELVHEALAEETQKDEPEAWKRYHKRALDHFTEVSPHSPDWYYHLLAYDEKQGLTEWQQAIQEARERGKHEFVGALLQAALDKALKLSPAARAEVVYEQGRFNYYSGQWEEALKSYQEALTSFQEVGDLSGQAKALAATGDAQRVLAKQDDALASYENAITIFQQIGDFFGAARCCQAMGDVRQLRNEPDLALQRYQQALECFRQLGNQTEQAKVLEAIGDMQRLCNQPDAALRSYEQALALYQEEKDRLKRAKVLKSIGDVQRLQQDQDAALESYAQALALFGELKEPAEEANVRRAIEEMQQPQSEQAAHSKEESISRTEPSVLEDKQQQGEYAVPQPRRGFSGVRTILLIGLALIVVAGSASFFLLNGSEIFPANTVATATAQANKTATPPGPTSTPPNSAATATASTIAANPDPYGTGGMLALYDPLHDNTLGNRWDEGSINGNTCIFIDGTYHVISNPRSFNYCFANATNFSNFVYEVQMTIIQGDAGGLLFRGSSANGGTFYYFSVAQDGHYEVVLCPPSSNSCGYILTGINHSALKQGLNEVNLLAVVAHGPIFTIYVNHKMIIRFNDRTFSQGQIGVFASKFTTNGLSTEVAFSNARVWTL